jgi:hypothetical protein
MGSEVAVCSGGSVAAGGSVAVGGTAVGGGAVGVAGKSVGSSRVISMVGITDVGVRGVRVGCLVGVGVVVGIRNVGDAVGGRSVIVGAGEEVLVGAGICVDVGLSLSLWVAVGSMLLETGVALSPEVKTDFNVMAAANVGVAVSRPVTGSKTGPDGLGTISTSICIARAAAVLFMLAKDKSCVFRACRSPAVGGAGLILTSTNTIHAIPEQRKNAAKAWRGTINFFINSRSDSGFGEHHYKCEIIGIFPLLPV